ncbi:hypothetical protein D9758_013699 [Tetrapyrgos nigripes]|uniref:Cytochrome P450 n=1 Tax=Tetrapyrgos nigripes TaxID=182062 RepID=A0A8H5CL88_9AGAR|nr:hypothetical protein D9758_013699 [Tetrapyrgos nigripes]
MSLTVWISLATASLLLLYSHRRNVRRSFSLANIPGPKSTSWLQGTFREVLSPAAWDFHKRILKEYGQVVRIDGFMGDKLLLVFDPKAMHHILVKDAVMYEKVDLAMVTLVMGKGLVGITGEPHRKQRKMLNPVFSIAHMRNMLPIFYNVVDKLENGLSAKLQNDASHGPQEIEMLSWMSRAALELIGQAGLGYSFDDLSTEATAHPYPAILKQLVTTGSSLWFLHISAFRLHILPLILKFGTQDLRRRILNMIPWKVGHHLRDMSDYLWDTSKQIYEGKKKALAEGDEAVSRQIGMGKDIMSILIFGAVDEEHVHLTAIVRMNMEEEEGSENKLDEDEVLGQMSVLIFAGMDTTSSALARVLHLLSTRPEIQDKLRQEIIDARSANGNKHILYDQLVSLPYLDAICRETLRLYSPVSHVIRYALQDTVLPLSTPIAGIDGTLITELHVPKNTHIIISVLNSNRNPAIWGPDALEWKPERWLSPLPDELVEAHIPGVYSHL